MSTINSKYFIKTSKSPILLKSIEAVKYVLRKIAEDDKIEVLGVTSDNDINREKGRVTQDVSNKPYFNLRISSISHSPQESGYNSFALMKYGSNPTAILDDNEYRYSFHLRPVTVTLSIKYFEQDYEKILQFMSNWIFYQREGTFALKSGDGLTVDIKIILDEELNTSEKDFNPGNPYVVNSTITMKTYVGNIYKTPKIQSSKVNFEMVTLTEFEEKTK